MRTAATRRTVIVVSLTLIVVVTVFALLRDPYRCLTTRHWLSMLQSGGWRTHHAAIALRRAPKDKLFPVIREWISTTNVAGNPQHHFFSKLSIVPMLSPEQKRSTAYHALAVLGPEAKPFVAELKVVALGPESDSTFDAAFALMTIVPEGQSVLAAVAPNDNKKAQVAKAAMADMLTQAAVNGALQNWNGQTGEDINRVRCIFNLKCLASSFRMYATQERQSEGATNAPPRGRRPRSIQPPP
jgi:hypothetical protein